MSVRVRMADDRHLFLESPSLVVGASWREDRWILGIARPVSSGRRTLLALSYPEHPDDDGKLLRPVFQQCYCRQTSSQTGELLLVGQCGRRHFSGVVTLSPGLVRIDVADRWTVPIPLTRIGVEFQIPPQAVAEVVDRVLQSHESPQRSGVTSVKVQAIRLTDEAGTWLLAPDFAPPLPGAEPILHVDPKQRTIAIYRPVGDPRTPPMTIAYGVRFTEEKSA